MLNRDDSMHELSHLGEAKYGLDDEQTDAIYYAMSSINLLPGIASTLEYFQEHNYQFEDAEERDHIDLVISSIIHFFKVMDKCSEQFLDMKIKMLEAELAREKAEEEGENNA